MKTRPSRSIDIFALVIGIKDYADPIASGPQLSYSTADADGFQSFLLNNLSVPASRIVNLRDRDASRSNIISALLALEENPDIVKDHTAIIIFYSGHGSSVLAPNGWRSSDGNVEILCPSDIGTGNPPVEGIPDLTISHILNRISTAKGNNITVILDCCCSSGATRGLMNDSVVRCLENPPPLDANCDHDIINGQARGVITAPGFSGHNNDSHVLLAACGRYQEAYENHGLRHGAFTSALLSVLTNTAIHELTYVTLMNRICMVPPPEPQIPHCVGRYVDRRIFTTHTDVGTQNLFPGRISGDRCTLSAGHIHGFVAGDEVEIYHFQHYSPSDPPLGVLELQKVESVESELPHHADEFEIPDHFYGKRVKKALAGGVKVHADDQLWLWGLFTRAGKTPSEIGVTIVGINEHPDITVSLTGSEVTFRHCNDIFEDSFVPCPAARTQDDDDDITHVLAAAARFYGHLKRTSSTAESSQVAMSMQVLEETDLDHEVRRALAPTGVNLLQSEPAEITVDPEASVAITLHNQSDCPLYPYLFYFDPSELSIISWYHPPIAAAGLPVDPPLTGQAKLMIGYGDGGANPLAFELKDEEMTDVGYLKLFLSTKCSDMRSVVQESPFIACAMPRGSDNTPRLIPGSWGSKSATIVQSRAGHAYRR